MRLTYDVLVVGAGPAGSTAARHLAAEGLDVAVLEEHAVVGEPVDCTGIVGADAFADFDLPEAVVIDTVRAVTLHSPAGIPATYRSSTPLAFVVNRAELDRSLAKVAQDAGATIFVNAQAVEIARDSRGVDILCRLPEGEVRRFSAKMVILAGGPRFAFHERLGLGTCPLVWRSAHAELSGDGLPHAQVFLGRDVAPGAFA
jgi:digeranylgeranylglycerophospholipid reductase